MPIVERYVKYLCCLNIKDKQTLRVEGERVV